MDEAQAPPQTLPYAVAFTDTVQESVLPIAWVGLIVGAARITSGLLLLWSSGILGISPFRWRYESSDPSFPFILSFGTWHTLSGVALILICEALVRGRFEYVTWLRACEIVALVATVAETCINLWRSWAGFGPERTMVVYALASELWVVSLALSYPLVAVGVTTRILRMGGQSRSRE
jgi:hypothetical protein